MSLDASSAYEFGAFRLEPAERRLCRDGRPVQIRPKAFDTLRVLVERGGHAVSKDELMAKVWPDTTVEDATLAQNIFTLRKLFGAATFIETVPKFGYRFIAAVTAVSSPPEERPRAGRHASKPSFWLRWGTRRIPLVEGSNVVGRDPDLEVTLDAATVSRRHARITVAAAVALLEDLGSKNGTFLADHRLTAPERLSDGDVVGFGSLVVSFHARLLLGSTETHNRPGSG